MGAFKSKFRKFEDMDTTTEELDESMEFKTKKGNMCKLKTQEFVAQFSTPIADFKPGEKRFQYLNEKKFLDPRSPSENILRTPISFKDHELSPIPTTPMLLDDEPFKESFANALSKISFDSNLEDFEDTPKSPVLETHFDFFTEKDQVDLPVPIKPLNLSDIQSKIDPRSPTVGIDRTPLVIAKAPEETKDDVPLIEMVHEDEIEEVEGEEPKATVFVDSNQVKFGTPVQNKESGEVRTPLSCLVNRPRLELGKTNRNSPLMKLRMNKENNDSFKVAKKLTRTEPRTKPIRS